MLKSSWTRETISYLCSRLFNRSDFDCVQLKTWQNLSFALKISKFSGKELAWAPALAVCGLDLSATSIKSFLSRQAMHYCFQSKSFWRQNAGSASSKSSNRPLDCVIDDSSK